MAPAPLAPPRADGADGADGWRRDLCFRVAVERRSLVLGPGVSVAVRKMQRAAGVNEQSLASAQWRANVVTGAPYR